jgi:hypothetical protein
VCFEDSSGVDEKRFAAGYPEILEMFEASECVLFAEYGGEVEGCEGLGAGLSGHGEVVKQFMKLLEETALKKLGFIPFLNSFRSRIALPGDADVWAE